MENSYKQRVTMARRGSAWIKAQASWRRCLEAIRLTSSSLFFQLEQLSLVNSLRLPLVTNGKERATRLDQTKAD